MKKAFTLVELLGVIIILGVIALIAFPIVDKSIKTGKEESLNSIIKTIEKAAQEYMTREHMGYTTSYDKVDLDELIATGYLKDNIINPVTNDKMNGCVVYKWQDEYNQYEYEYQDPCTVKTLIETLLGQYNESNTTGLVKDTTNPNLYYYTGTNEQVSNNFLWYGGHQWRVLEFDTEAKTLTLITQQPLTAIKPASEVWTTQEAYESSYINSWLNEYFWSSLDNRIKNNILDSTFNVGIYNEVNEITTVQKVGLLDQTQYYRAGSADSFLDIKDYFWLGNRYSSSFVCIVDNNGTLNSNSLSSTKGVRAVIKISDITIAEGDGTLANNYQVTGKSMNTNNVQVGEYINVPYSGNDNACGNDNICTFRVVSKDADSIKVVLNGLLSNESEYGNSATITTSHTIYASLNTFAEGISDAYQYTGNKTFYIGDYPPTATSYEDVKDEQIRASVGLPTVGEMFSGNDIDIDQSIVRIFVDINTIENPTISTLYWTMNRYTEKLVLRISSFGDADCSPYSIPLGVRPVIFLKNNLEFTGGEGTAQSPYTLE